MINKLTFIVIRDDSMNHLGIKDDLKADLTTVVFGTHSVAVRVIEFLIWFLVALSFYSYCDWSDPIKLRLLIGLKVVFRLSKWVAALKSFGIIYAL